MQNSEGSLYEFHCGTKVKWFGKDGYAFYGEVAIVAEKECKIIFSNNSSHHVAAYRFYPKSELTILTEQEYDQGMRT